MKLGINAAHDFLNTTNISHNPIKNANSVQSMDIPTRVLLLLTWTKKGTNVDSFKKTKVRSLYKKMEEQKNQTIDPLVFI